MKKLLFVLLLLVSKQNLYSQYYSKQSIFSQNRVEAVLNECDINGRNYNKKLDIFLYASDKVLYLRQDKVVIEMRVDIFKVQQHYQGNSYYSTYNNPYYHKDVFIIHVFAKHEDYNSLVVINENYVTFFIEPLNKVYKPYVVKYKAKLISFKKAENI